MKKLIIPFILVFMVAAFNASAQTEKQKVKPENQAVKSEVSSSSDTQASTLKAVENDPQSKGKACCKKGSKKSCCANKKEKSKGKSDSMKKSSEESSESDKSDD